MTERAGERFPRDLAAAASELLPDGLVVAEGPQGVVSFVNRRAVRILGVPEETLVGHRLTDCLPFHDRTGVSWWDAADPWGSLSTTSGHRERLLMLPTGAEVLVTARYLRRERGGPVRAVLVGLRDAEGRRRAEADSAALLSTVAHELRSPLTGVKGFSATLLRNWDRFSDAEKRVMIETIEADADRVTRLITELLDVSRINTGHLRVHAQVVEVAPVLQRERQRRSASGSAPEEIVIDVPADLPAVWVDPDRLEQIITNLVDNALRHGRPPVTLSARASVVEGFAGVDVIVTDDGDGIPEHQRELAFTRFWQGGTTTGTGLGLYLVRGLVEAHGGTIAVEDAPGGGALMRVTFPAYEPT